VPDSNVTDHAGGHRPQIGVGAAHVSPLQRKYVNQALRANRLSYGPFTEQFEREFAKRHDVKVALFTNSGTSALQVAVNALKIRDGWKDDDEVIVPALTFVASANVVIRNNLKPVFVDVDPDYFELDPARLEAAISPRTRAIMPVHIAGLPCDMGPIMDIANRHRIRVIEDSCEAMFVRYRGRPVGSFGDIACFSTYVAHILVTGVGGLAVTSDPDLAVLMKSLFNHGRDSIYIHIDDDQGVSGERLFDVVSRRFRFVHVGYSYRATELEGALGLGELARADRMLAARARNAKFLTRGLADLQREGLLQLPKTRPDSQHAFMFFPVVVTEKGGERDRLVFFLEERGIETRYLLPLINQPVYLEAFGELEPKFPVAASLNRTAFYIGCHPFLTRSELAYVVEQFHEFFRRDKRSN
jgi:dTDP-4-amino-4,6-dideoxygalactose transaminase